MRRHIYTGAMGSVWAAIISGIFFVYFGNTIGLTRFQWGLMGSISSWLIVAQVLSARITAQSGRRKLIWFSFTISDRLVRSAGIFIALYFYANGIRGAGTVLITAVCLANLLGTMGAPPWLSWLTDIVPEREHGGFIGRRAAWIALSTIIVVIPAGFLMDSIDDAHKMRVVVLLFTFATMLGIVDILIHGTIPEPPGYVERVRSSLIRDFAQPLRDRRYRPWLMFNASWTFSMTLGGALSTLYFVENLNLKSNFLGGIIVLTAFSLLGTLLTGKASGRLIDRNGVKRVLLGSHIVWATLPLFWLFASPESALVFLGLGSVVGGISSTAGANAGEKLMTRLPAANLRPMYVAVSSTIGNFAGGFGVLAAGTVLQYFERAQPEILAGSAGGFKLLFIISFGLRLLSALIFIPRIRYQSDRDSHETMTVVS